MRHAICQANFSVSCKLDLEISAQSKEYHMVNACTALHIRIQEGHESALQEACAVLRRTYILGNSLSKLLKDDRSNNKCIKLCKALLGIEVGMESMMYDTEFISAAVSKQFKSNMSGFRYVIYIGTETIYFRRQGMAEYFVHDGDMITIVCNFRDIRGCLHYMEFYLLYNLQIC